MTKNSLEEKSGFFKSFKKTAGPLMIAPYAGFTTARKLLEVTGEENPSFLSGIGSYAGFLTGIIFGGAEYIGTVALSSHLTGEPWSGLLLIGSSQVINYFYESSKEKDKKNKIK